MTVFLRLLTVWRRKIRKCFISEFKDALINYCIWKTCVVIYVIITLYIYESPKVFGFFIRITSYETCIVKWPCATKDVPNPGGVHLYWPLYHNWLRTLLRNRPFTQWQRAPGCDCHWPGCNSEFSTSQILYCRCKQWLLLADVCSSWVLFGLAGV